MKNTFLILIVLAALIAPSCAELTDYQKGFEAGLKSGFALGQAYQQSNDGKISIQQYNQVAASYNALIQSLFSGNQTAINTLLINPTATATTDVSPNVYPIGSYVSNNHIHAIGSSFNQTNRSVMGPQGQTIYGEPIDHYCTDNPNAPACNYVNTPFNGLRDSKGNLIGSDQPLGGV